MAYFGKEFILGSQENFDGFIESLKLEIPEEALEAVINFKPFAKIENNGDEYTYTSNKVDGSITSTTFKDGVEYEETNYGKTAKVAVTVDGDTFTHVQTYPDTIITFKRVFSPDEIVTTITHSEWDGEAKRIYKAK